MIYVKVRDCLYDEKKIVKKNFFSKSFQVLNCPNWLVGWIGGKEVEVKMQKINLLTKLIVVTARYLLPCRSQLSFTK